MGPVSYRLPLSVVTVSDISELIRELDSIENFFMKIKMRRSGMPITLPKTTHGLEELVGANNVNLLKDDERAKLKLFLQTVKIKAPILHISFSADPTRSFLEKIVQWFRTNVNPFSLLQVGLQPNIGAGFTLRTNNRFFDFSLRQYLSDNRPELIKGLTEGIKWV